MAQYLYSMILSMLKTCSSICFLSLISISLYSAVFILQEQQQQYAAAIDLTQSMHITLVHATIPDLIANNQKNSTMDKTAQNSSSSSTISQKQEQATAASIKNFQEAFCGVNETPSANSNSNGYITEYTLPQSCEMPLGIAIDNNANKVWYLSTKRGILGSYDIKQNIFDQEHIIPIWKSREDQVGYSQVWSVKVDNNNNKKQGGEGEDIWFTDAGQNAIWRYIKDSQVFEIYKIPGKSSSFGTTYPISLEFNSKSNKIFFVGTYSRSLWIGDISKMRNGTSDGISQIPIPIDNSTFNGIDPLYVTIGSLAIDNKRNSVLVSVFSYGNKGEIFRYNLESQSFDKRLDLPPELSSPVGMDVDEGSGHVWITNAGSSMFYELNPNNGKITKFVTSKVSPRIFGQGLFQATIAEQKKIHGDNSSNDNIFKNAYTLPYWIQKATDGSLWFNEQEGNKIGRFDPHDMKLIEYWVPSQNRLWDSCGSNSHSDNSSYFNNSNSKNVSNNENNSNNNSNDNQTCGIANILQLSINPQNHDDNEHHHRSKDVDHKLEQHVWFTEWSENKIGKVDTNDQLLPFSVVVSSIPHNKEITIKRGESKEIKVKVIPEESTFSSISDNMNIHMLASGTFTATGDLGNSTGSFTEESFSIDTEDNNSKHDVSFTFTASPDLKPGRYTLMIGAENDAVSYLKAIKIRVI